MDFRKKLLLHKCNFDQFPTFFHFVIPFGWVHQQNNRKPNQKQRCRWVFKSVWVSSNMVGIICPPRCNRVNWTAHPLAAALKSDNRMKKSGQLVRVAFSREVQAWRSTTYKIGTLVSRYKIGYILSMKLVSFSKFIIFCKLK